MKTTQSSTRRLTELHIIKARELAFRLLSVASTRYPFEWAGALIIEPILMDLCEFCFHARRVMDLCKIDNADVISTQLNCFNNLNDIVFEKDYKSAINSFHHVSDLTVGWSEWLGEKIYTNSPKEMILSHITVGGRQPATISLFGVAFAYLVDIIPKIKTNFPDYQF